MIMNALHYLLRNTYIKLLFYYIFLVTTKSTTISPLLYVLHNPMFSIKVSDLFLNSLYP